MSRPNYEFGRFRLDPTRRVLQDSTTGEVIALAARGFDTLLCLVERRGKLVSKSELLEAVWPNAVVEENNLNQSIAVVRRALGEKPGENRYIVNVTGRGYQFIAEVVEVAAAPMPAAPGELPAQTNRGLAGGRRRFTGYLAAVLIAIALFLAVWLHANRERDVPAKASAPKNSVAVMPFANLTKDPGNDYLGEGIAEEVIHALAGVPTLKVPARTSTFAYKDRAADVRQIAKDLGVQSVLEGSVRSSGEKIRVTVQLADGETGFHIWSQAYERDMRDLFELQDEIAASIVRALGVDTGRAQTLPASSGRGTHDVEAWRLQTQADALIFRRPTAQNLQEAIKLLDQALARDPGFFRAWSTRAFACLTARLWYRAPHDMDGIQQDAERGVELGASSGVSHAVLAMVLLHRGAWIQAEEHWRQALSLGRDDPTLLARSADMSLRVGHIREGVERAKRAQALAPADPELALRLSLAHLVAGDDQLALESANFAERVGWQPDVPPLSGIYSALTWRAGDRKSSLKYEMANLRGERSADALEALRLVYLASENPDARKAAVRALVKNHRATLADPADIAAPWFSIRWLVALGALDEAFEAANASQSLAQSSEFTSNINAGLLWDPGMKPFRLDPRFHDYVERLGLVEYWKQFGPPDGCELHEGRTICR